MYDLQIRWPPDNSAVLEHTQRPVPTVHLTPIISWPPLGPSRPSYPSAPVKWLKRDDWNAYRVPL